MAQRWFELCPDEILLSIFLLLPDAQTMLGCRLLNKRCRECIDSSTRLQYEIRLDAWGYEDVGPSNSDGVSVAERMKRLEEHIIAWSTLDWHETSIVLPKPGVRHISQGVWVAVPLSLRNTLMCIDLPSRLWGRPCATRNLSFSFPIRDFVVDPSQDLLILLEV